MKLQLIRLVCNVFCLCLAAVGQSDQASPQEPSAATPVTPLAVASRVEIAATSPYIALPVRCGPDHSIFLRMASSEGITDLFSISAEGKILANFSLGKISDVGSPRLRSFFIGDSGVYILVSGLIPQDKMLKLRKSGGETEQQAVASQPFIARFALDGTYQGAVPLDLSFQPYQAGVFANGYFLIAGTTKDNQARVALVKPTGQFHRMLETPGDIHVKRDSETEPGSDKSGLSLTGERLLESFYGAVRTSYIIADGANLLLVRTGQKVPIFSISPAGEVRAVPVEIPDGFTIMDVKPAGNLWIILCSRLISDEAGLAFETFAFNPATGAQLRRYAYPRFMGSAMACADGNEFTYLARENEKLKLITLTPTQVPNSLPVQ